MAPYNASALDYRTANGWLAQAVAARDAAASAAMGTRAAAAVELAFAGGVLGDVVGDPQPILSPGGELPPDQVG